MNLLIQLTKEYKVNRIICKARMVVDTSNANIWETGKGRHKVWDQPGPHSDLFQKKETSSCI